MVDKMGKAKETEKAEKKKKAEELIKKTEELIKEVEKLITDKLKDKTLRKNNPFVVDDKIISGLPETLKKFGDNEKERNWIFYGPPGTGKTFALNKIIPTQRICINNTDETQGEIKQLYSFLYQPYIPEPKKSRGFNKLFFEIVNRFISIPFIKYNIKTYLKCKKSKENQFPFVIGTEGLLDEKGKPKSDDMADMLFKEYPNLNYQFKKECDEKSFLNIVPRLFEQGSRSDLINTINFDKIRDFVINIVNFNLKELSLEKYEDVTKIVFHPSYTYEDFIGGIKPDLEQIPLKGTPPEPSGLSTPNSLTYKYTPGVMLDLIRKAWGNKGGRYYLIIDEFNRGNIAAIFGEFLYLIENDKRSEDKNSGDDYVFLPGGVYPWDDDEGKEVTPFSDECKIRMPGNIFIVGALNTADRSIATMDFAMRRRFNFVKFEPNEELIKGFNWIPHDDQKEADNYLKILFLSLNKSINYKLDADHEIGHYYLMPAAVEEKNDTIVFLKDLFKQKIVPLLEAYCDHDEQAVNRILELTRKIMKEVFCKIVKRNIIFGILLSTQKLRTMDREFLKDSKTEELIKDFWNLTVINDLPVINNVIIDKLLIENTDIGETVSTPANPSDSQ